ncbi:MAG TPA: hypothetical protein VNT30_22705 [Stellaceae bacterium]|nr:hypothetical protein [Stellaceae bacterium]
MNRTSCLMGAISGAWILVFALAPGAAAHGIAGNRVFPTTLTIDDPAVSDEASLPTITYQRSGATADNPATRQANFSVEYDKRITEHLGVALNGGYTITDQVGQGSLYGFQNFSGTLKYQFLQDAEHELLMSAGVIRQFGGTGAQRVGADPYGSTTPTLYFGKGLGDLPNSVAYLRPFAITGTLGYQFADVPTQSVTVVDPTTGSASLQYNHSPNQLVMGASVQYSLPYLQSQVKDIGLPEFLGRVTPLVEFAYTTPATRGYGQSTQGTIAPGLLYDADSYQVGVEALIPATHGSGTNVGAIIQLHLFLDDIFPNTIGKPIFGG